MVQRTRHIQATDAEQCEDMLGLGLGFQAGLLDIMLLQVSKTTSVMCVNTLTVHVYSKCKVYLSGITE